MDRVILLFLLAVFALATPAVARWTSESTPWYVAYLLWFVIILLAAWLHHSRGSHDL